MKKRNVAKAFITLLVVSALFCGCSAKDSTGLKIGILSNMDAIPIVIAQEQGYLENVSIEMFSSAKDRDTAFNAGALDGIAADILAESFLKQAKEDAYITSLTQGSFILVAGKNSGITDMSMIDGKSAAISQNTIIEYTFDKMSQNAINIKKEIVPQITARLEMLNEGKIDIALFPEPFATAAMDNGAKRLADADEMGYISGVMIFKGDAIKNKNNNIKNFYNAYDKAVDYINSNDRAEYIDFIIAELGFPESVKDTLEIPTYRKAALPSQDLITPVQQWLVERKLIEKEFTYDDLINKDFIND